VNNTFYFLSFNPSNEIAIRGLTLGSWRAALAAEWTLNSEQTSEYASELRANYNQVRRRSIIDDRDADAWMFDVAAARILGGNRVLGFRFRASGYYHRLQNASQETVYDYYGVEVGTLRISDKYNDLVESLHRRIAFDFQMSLANREAEGIDDEFILSVSRLSPDRLAQEYDENKGWHYDISGEMSRYEAIRDFWSDARSGDLWRFGASYRGALGAGVRVFAGGAISSAAYDASYGYTIEETEWNYGPILTDRFTESSGGSGGGAFLKAGRQCALHRALDIYIGLRASFASTRAEEKTLVRNRFIENNQSMLGYDATVDLAYTSMRAELGVPVSIEYRPTGWFSYFASFVPGASWQRTAAEKPQTSSFEYSVPFARSSRTCISPAWKSSGQTFDPSTVEESVEESLDSSHDICLGFSLRYAERLSLEFYTGTSILPTSFSAVYGTVMYGF
jgi:hypothetical protein